MTSSRDKTLFSYFIKNVLLLHTHTHTITYALCNRHRMNTDLDLVNVWSVFELNPLVTYFLTEPRSTGFRKDW